MNIPFNQNAIQGEKMAFFPPSDATAVPCVQINACRVMARMRLSTLLRLTSDPRKTEKAKDRASDFRLQEAYEMRQTVQREFKGIKARNVPKFSDYLIKVEDKSIDGLAPAIKLYCPGKIIVDEREDGTAMAYISLDDELVAYDGETQLAAWFAVAAQRPDLREKLVPVDLSFGREVKWARQVWHDVNIYGSRPNAALSLSMDARDPINQVAEYVEERIPFFTGQVNKLKRQVRAGEGYFTLTTFRGACVTFAKGISGVSLGMKPVPGISEDDVDDITDIAIEFFTGLAATIGNAIRDPHFLANSPAVFSAIGALGTPLLKQEDASVRAAKLSTIMQSLAEVNWAKGHHWNGIAGKVVTTVTPSGRSRSRFSLAGPKEASHTVFKALSDPKHPTYAQIRNTKALALDDDDDDQSESTSQQIDFETTA